MAAVFAGCTAVLTIAALAYREPLVLVVAAPFAVSTYFFWYQATGRLEARIRRRAARARRRADAGRGGFGAGPREDWRAAGDSRGRRAPGAGAAGARERERRPARTPAGPSEAEARRVLGVDRGEDEEAVRRAYRDRVKEAHPDADSGSEEAFRRVQAAYERLRD